MNYLENDELEWVRAAAQVVIERERIFKERLERELRYHLDRHLMTLPKNAAPAQEE